MTLSTSAFALSSLPGAKESKEKYFTQFACQNLDDDFVSNVTKLFLFAIKVTKNGDKSLRKFCPLNRLLERTDTRTSLCFRKEQSHFTANFDAEKNSVGAAAAFVAIATRPGSSLMSCCEQATTSSHLSFPLLQDRFLGSLQQVRVH